MDVSPDTFQCRARGRGGRTSKIEVLPCLIVVAPVGVGDGRNSPDFRGINFCRARGRGGRTGKQGADCTLKKSRPWAWGTDAGKSEPWFRFDVAPVGVGDGQTPVRTNGLLIDAVFLGKTLGGFRSGQFVRFVFGCVRVAFLAARRLLRPVVLPRTDSSKTASGWSRRRRAAQYAGPLPTGETMDIPSFPSPAFGLPTRRTLNVGRLERDHERGQRDVVTTSIVVERSPRLRQIRNKFRI
jgi:hypothetical protein